MHNVNIQAEWISLNRRVGRTPCTRRRSHSEKRVRKSTMWAAHRESLSIDQEFAAADRDGRRSGRNHQAPADRGQRQETQSLSLKQVHKSPKRLLVFLMIVFVGNPHSGRLLELVWGSGTRHRRPEPSEPFPSG